MKERKSERKKEKAKERVKEKAKDRKSKRKSAFCNKEMDTWVSAGRQQHVTHYRQRLEKSLVFLLQSHHMKTNSSSKAQNSSK